MSQRTIAAETWREVAEVLGIRVTAPFEVANDSNTDRVEYVAFLPDFGGKAGMVVGLMDSIADYERLAGFAKSAGLYFSATDFSYYANWGLRRHLFGIRESRGRLRPTLDATHSERSCD
jgi:hypothetical protein